MPPSPANPNAAASSGCGGSEPVPNANCGNPINAATGNKLQIETDYVGAANTGLSLTRYYNSMDTGVTPFGAGWRSPWHRGLVVSGNTVTVTRSDGRQDIFFNNGGVYTADFDVTSILTATGNSYQLATASDTTETYDAASGHLLSVSARSGLTTTLAYTGNNLATVTGPFGHVLSFTYNGLQQIATMTAPDGGVYAYAYDTLGNLTSVTYPDKTIRQYVYENTAYPNFLTGIIDENGNRFATWGYDTQGRAISSQHANGVELTTVAYNTNGPRR